MRNFDLAAHLNTAPELLNRVYNRPTLETLRKQTVKGLENAKQLKVSMLAKQRKILIDSEFESNKILFGNYLHYVKGTGKFFSKTKYAVDDVQKCITFNCV